MKAKEIFVGLVYWAKVSGKVTRVRVDAIREVVKRHFSVSQFGVKATRLTTVYDVTNLATRRSTTFHSPTRFRSEATSTAKYKSEANAIRSFLKDSSHVNEARQAAREALANSVETTPEVGSEAWYMKRSAEQMLPETD